MPRQSRREFYRRRLPHWQPDAAILFITFRLFGSLPRETIERLADERRLLHLEPRRPDESPRLGVVGVVDVGDVVLHRYVIMPNHVHALTLSFEPIEIGGGGDAPRYCATSCCGAGFSLPGRGVD